MPSSSSSKSTMQGKHGSSSSSLLGGGGGGLVAGSAGRQMARLGVTTDYVDLSLHSACANGNIGLVQYALQNGQPVNSVLNGVLPLHAAASSGSEAIVRMLLEHGADVNSPRLPRRYSNDRSRTSGLAVGTAGSTPLHFAAANGHTSIISLLLSHGANPAATEKYGLTPEFMATQKGHPEAAAVLRRWQEEETDRDGVSSSATSIRSLGKKRIHPQRSFDALAVKLQQHASHPHLPHSLQMSSSSTSVNTIHSIHPANSSGASVHRRLSVPGHVKDSLSTRRPSLPSVFEKAAHPSSTLKQALGLKGRRGSDGSSLRKGSGKTHPGSTMWSRGRSNSLLGEDDEAIGEEEDEDLEAEEVPNRRRSEELYRPTRPGSISSLVSLEQPTTAPATKTSFHTSEYAPPPAITSRPLPPFHSSSSSASLAHTFYRPRQSSQLSGRPTLSPQATAGAPPSPRVFVDDDDDEEGGDDSASTDARPPSASPRSASLRSPLHYAHRRQSTTSSYSLGSSAPSTSHRSSSGLATPEMGSARASAETSEDGSQSGRGAARKLSRTPPEPRLGFVIRDRAPRGDSSGPSAVRRAGLAAATALNGGQRLDAAALNQSRSGDRAAARTTGIDNLKKVETRTSRSNSAGTDGRFSSSPASSYSGPGAFSTYAPSNSTAATSVHPSSPSVPYAPRQQPLTPLYETTHSHHSGPKNVTTSAQAHSRVKQAEQELMAYNPSDSSSGGATNRPTLAQQLAAYGKSLAVERKLASEEGKTEYRFETIGTSGGKPPSTQIEPLPAVKPVTTSRPLDQGSSSKLAVPHWRAIPSSDRLMPPPPGRRSVSPSSQHKGRESHAPIVTYSPVSAPSSASTAPASSASTPSSPPRTRASTPSSASSAANVAAPHILGANPALNPKAAVSYVEVTPPSSSHPGSTTRVPHTHTHGVVPSKRSDRAHSAKGASSVTSAKDQLELDAIEQARIAAAVPTAVITAKKKGGLRRLFGNSKA